MPTAGFPTWFSLKWCVLVLLLMLFGLSSAAALWNIGILYLPTAQSQSIALLIATPWVLSAIGAKKPHGVAMRSAMLCDCAVAAQPRRPRVKIFAPIADK